MCIFNIFRKSTIQEVGKTISWKDSVNLLFKVLDFDRNETVISGSGELKTKSLFKPYGYLIVQNPHFTKTILLPVVHRDDFLLADSVFSDINFSEVIKSEDLLVIYKPRVETSGGRVGVYHGLHYVIAPAGTMNKYYEKYGKTINTIVLESLFVKFSWDEIRVQINKNPII